MLIYQMNKEQLSESVPKLRMTYAMYATMNHNHGDLKHIVDVGCDLDATDSAGCTALKYAVIEDNITALRILLKGGADPTKRCHDGKQPIDFAKNNHRRKTMYSILDKAMYSNRG